MSRKLAAPVLAALVALALTPVSARSAPTVVPCPTGSVPIFAGGGTAVSNGYFFPGTAIYDGQKLDGVPYTIAKGCDLEFVNLDAAVVTNGHKIVSIKRDRWGRPLFRSRMVNGPGTASVLTSHLRVGTYPFACTTHYGMYGLLEIARP